MPTRYRPELTHNHFDWHLAQEALNVAIAKVRAAVLEAVGFYAEYGDLADHAPLTDEQFAAAGDDVLSEIVGLLAWAAAINVDAGFKPVNRVVATLSAIARNPRLVVEQPDAIEPEALGALAKAYGRYSRAVGRHPFDITGETGRTPNARSICAAARWAIEDLQAEKKRGRRKLVVIDFLASELVGVFGRFAAAPIGRRVGSETAGGPQPGEEYGPLKDFLELLWPPFQELLAGYPGPSAPSVDVVIRRAIERRKAARPRGRPKKTA